MIGTSEIDRVQGATAYDTTGSKVGKVDQIYLDDQSGEPNWVTVNTGMFGTSTSFVPLEGASFDGDDIRLAYDKDRIKGAPRIDVDQHLEREQEDELYRYYGLSAGGQQTADTGQTFEPGWQAGDERYDHTGEAGVVGHDTSGPTTDNAMTRSEEQLQVGTQSQEAGRARLRKYVTSETQTQTVPVTKERAVVEREPITDANVGAATDGPAISEEEHEVVLHEEVPVTDKTVTPVERVRLGTEQVTEQQTVTGEVRKEQVEVEGDADSR
jgi:uncharacterized protein (TIGR02271 family)